MTNAYYWPMLAKAGAQTDLDRLQTSGEWAFESKYDGVRCLAHLGSSKIVLRSRAGKDITSQFPDIVERLRPLSESGLTVLDGEIICYADDNELMSPPSFQRLQTRLQRKVNIDSVMRENPAHYKVFDVLCHNNMDYCNSPYVLRRNIVNELFIRYHAFDYSAADSNGTMLFNFITKHGYEGIIAKHKQSIYKQGTRSSDWIKIKPTLRVFVEVIGMTRGTGRRKSTFGALVTYKDKQFQGLVGTGFTDADLATLFVKVLTSTYGAGTYPDPADVFSNQVPRTINRQVTNWCAPFRIEVEYQERTKDNIMRFPAFVRLIDD